MIDQAPFSLQANPLNYNELLPYPIAGRYSSLVDGSNQGWIKRFQRDQEPRRIESRTQRPNLMVEERGKRSRNLDLTGRATESGQCGFSHVLPLNAT
jgi:hypothetical protein